MKGVFHWRATFHILALLVVAGCQNDLQVPAAVVPATAATITGIVGTPVRDAPMVTVKDQNGRSVAGAWVNWTVSAGGGSVNTDSTRTDASGVAHVGVWMLGPTAGLQTLLAVSKGLPATVFTAQASADSARALLPVGAAQTGVVNTLVAAPAVRAVDQFGNPVRGVAVLFTVASGSGLLTGVQQTTGADGVATAGSWTLGTIAGDQTVRASSLANLASTILTARALGGAAIALVAVDGDAQSGFTGKRLCISPAVKALDVYGNGVGQIPISFAPLTGGGTVSTNTVLTDATTGRAAVGEWTLGNGSTQTLVATSTLLPGKQVRFNATAGVAQGYSMCARFVGDAGTPRQREAVTKALARWQSVIVGHVGTTHLTAPAGECVDGIPAIDEDIEDVLIYVQLAAIDGPLNTIGQSSPCYLHSSGLTMMGFLQLDIADLELMLTAGTLDNVVLHEIGHILGIGTLWSFRHNLLTGRSTSDPFFAGAVAREQFALTGSVYAGTPVPVENSGGVGTRDSHWRRTVFRTELMQGYVAPFMPMSGVTIGSLADLGYIVNLGAADAFSLLPSLMSDDAPAGMPLSNDVTDTPVWTVEKNGTRSLTRIPTVPIRK